MKNSLRWQARLLCGLLLVFVSVWLGRAQAGSALAHSALAKEQWMSVRSQNFFLVGNVGEKDLRRVGTKLEQFRDVFSKLFPQANVNSLVPIRVIVFRNRSEYQPFMPVYQGKINEVSGYFQPGQDVNYITLTADLNSQNPYRTIFHEYVHALLSDATVRPPVWFNEGLAEFYSMFEISDGDRKVTLGLPVASHVYLLRENKFLPLARLFAVSHGDPEYNERDKKGVFYAEAWALVHYLLLGNGGQRQPQFINYLSQLTQGVAIGDAFQRAFQTDFVTLEKELRDYINRRSYPIQEYTLNAKLTFDATMQSAPVSEAEAQFYLGDLLVHMNRSDGLPYLENALTLDANLPAAHASLGLAKARAKDFAAAKKHLQRAVQLNAERHAPDYLISYYYAQTLLDELSGELNYVSDIPAATAQVMRAQLQQALKLKPEFVEAYRVLALVNLVTNEQLPEMVTLLKRALQLAPRREDLSVLLSQFYLREEKYAEARQLLTPLAANAIEPRIRQQAQSMLDAVNRMAEMRTRFPAQQENAVAPPSAPQNATPPAPLNLRPRFEGDKVEGVLTRVDCNDKGITLTVKAAQRSFTLRTATPEQLQFITYSQEMGTSFTCGPLNPAPRVVVTYRSSTDAKAGVDGEPIAVEFVKIGN